MSEVFVTIPHESGIDALAELETVPGTQCRTVAVDGRGLTAAFDIHEDATAAFEAAVLCKSLILTSRNIQEPKTHIDDSPALAMQG